jgi:glycosyltransferase involved in cell wall biosynthesis
VTTFPPTVSIIVPTYKEAENLPLLIPQVAAALSPRGIHWELIVIDDNSPDDTREVLDRLALRFPQLRYLIRTHDRGLSSAVIAGLELALHDYIIVMDADLSHPPESLPDLLDPLASGTADFVIGSRYVPGGKTESWSRLRWLNSAGATLLAKPLVGTVRDPMAGFFAFRRIALRQADALNPIGYKIGLELIVKMRIDPDRVAEVPITFRNRIHGESKLTLKEQFRYLEHLSRLYDYRFPKTAPRSKFLIAAAAGALACYSALLPLHLANLPQPISIAAGLIAMILVTLAFFARYVRAQRDFIIMKSPYAEFAAISFAEFLLGWTAAVATPADLVLQTSVGIAMLLLVRYTLRKVFLHDLRGIHGTPTPKASLRLTLAPSRRTTAASA